MSLLVTTCGLYILRFSQGDKPKWVACEQTIKENERQKSVTKWWALPSPPEPESPGEIKEQFSTVFGEKVHVSSDLATPYSVMARSNVWGLSCWRIWMAYIPGEFERVVASGLSEVGTTEGQRRSVTR